MNNKIDENKDNSTKWYHWLIIIVIIIIIIVSSIAGLYLTLVRYDLIHTAIKSGDTGATVGLLSPEISSGIRNIFSK